MNCAKNLPKHSIKPEYFENTPFANLTDAISSWLYGNFSNTATVVYVVDGNIVPDVNVYSIYDIQEITLVQNAAVQLNGATGQAQLVVIKTKKNKDGKFGMHAAGQTFLENNSLKTQGNTTPYHSDVNVYHQYYLSAYQNTKNIQYGASASFLRDVLPFIKADSIQTSTPYNIGRFRLNAYLNAQLGKYNTLLVNVNYTPETFAYNQYITEPAITETIRQTLHQTQNLLTPWLRLHSKFSNEFYNYLTAGYYVENSKGRQYSLDNYEPASYPTPDSTTSTYNYYGKKSTFFIGDHVGYAKQLGNWLIEPAVDFRFSKLKDTTYQTSTIVYPQGIYQSGAYATSSKASIYLLTPSFTLGYKNIFGLQSGFVEILNKLTGSSIKKTYPFVTASFDIIKTISGSTSNSLKLFGSYAKTVNLSDPSYPLQDFSVSPTATSTNVNYSFNTGSPYGFPYQINLSTWLAQGGVTWQAMRGRLCMSYNYERRAFNAPVEIYIPFNGGIFELWMPLVTSTTNRLAINIKFIDGKNVTWFSGLTVSTLTINKGIVNPFVAEYATGDYNTSKPSFTGGWVNRGRYKNIVFGLDVMYHLNQQTFVPIGYNVTPQRKNSLLLQNVYAGYKIKNTELYIAGRNLFQNNVGDLTNGNRYYGVGFKTGILK